MLTTRQQLASPGADFYEQFYEQTNFSPTVQGKNLKINIDFLIKDGLDGTLGELLATWSNKQDVQEYTNAAIYVIDNPLAAKLLSVGSNMIKVFATQKGKHNLFYAVGALAQQICFLIQRRIF